VADAYTLDARTFERLVRMLRWFEGRGEGAPASELPNWQFVRCTGPRAGAGTGSGSGSGSGGATRYQPGEVVLWDAAEEDWLALGEVWMHEANNRPFAEGVVYPGRQSGDFEAEHDDIRPLFVCTLLGGSGKKVRFELPTCVQAVLQLDGSGDGGGDPGPTGPTAPGGSDSPTNPTDLGTGGSGVS
jgi:hypothetical protein